jgi:hypothetical protein
MVFQIMPRAPTQEGPLQRIRPREHPLREASDTARYSAPLVADRGPKRMLACSREKARRNIENQRREAPRARPL